MVWSRSSLSLVPRSALLPRRRPAGDLPLRVGEDTKGESVNRIEAAIIGFLVGYVAGSIVASYLFRVIMAAR